MKHNAIIFTIQFLYYCTYLFLDVYSRQLEASTYGSPNMFILTSRRQVFCEHITEYEAHSVGCVHLHGVGGPWYQWIYGHPYFVGPRLV